jgi:hypothetical protein
MPISSDTIESLFSVAKIHGTGETKDANRIAQRIPVLCGALTRQDAENVAKISVKDYGRKVRLDLYNPLITSKNAPCPCPDCTPAIVQIMYDLA